MRKGQKKKNGKKSCDRFKIATLILAILDLVLKIIEMILKRI